ncbi:MAG: hypothetical protein ABUS51_04480 [Acidobacteriota bacterium]
MIAIVEQSTGQAIFNDIEKASVTTGNISSPELDEALGKVAANTAAVQRSAPLNAPPPGKPLVVVDTAVDATGWYVLIWPYHPSLGPAVAKFDTVGKLVDRVRLRASSAASTSFMQLEGTGTLVLASTAGDVLFYTR